MTNPAAGVAYIRNPNGEVKPYRLFSVRLPEFLEKYPISEGYRVVVEHSDFIQSQSTLITLYKLAMESGKSPCECGLPALPAANTYIFKATLLDPDGKEVSAATSAKEIVYHKDWEAGETAARQRLLASLGFGGDCFDDDEYRDIASRSGQITSAASYDGGGYPFIDDPVTASGPSPEHDAEFKESLQHIGQAASGAAMADPVPVAEKQQSEMAQAEAVVTQKAEEPEVATTGPATQQLEMVSSDTSSAIEASEGGEEIPQRILNQLQHRANLHGVPVPKPKTVAEAKAELKKLMANPA